MERGIVEQLTCPWCNAFVGAATNVCPVCGSDVSSEPPVSSTEVDDRKRARDRDLARVLCFVALASGVVALSAAFLAHLLPWSAIAFVVCLAWIAPSLKAVTGPPSLEVSETPERIIVYSTNPAYPRSLYRRRPRREEPVDQWMFVAVSCAAATALLCFFAIAGDRVGAAAVVGMVAQVVMTTCTIWQFSLVQRSRTLGGYRSDTDL